MEEKLYKSIKEKIKRGMSLREACGQNGSVKTLFIRERKKRNEFVERPNIDGRSSCASISFPLTNLEYTPTPVTQETLDTAENHLFGLLLEQIKRGDTRASRMMLDLLKSRHPEYKEKAGRSFTPDDYKEVWEKIKNGHAKNGNTGEGEEVPGKTV